MSVPPRRLLVASLHRRGSRAVLALFLALPMAACGGSTSTSPPAVEPSADESRPPSDPALATDEAPGDSEAVDSSDEPMSEDDDTADEPECVPVVAGADEEEVDPDREPTPAELAASAAAEALEAALDEEDAPRAKRLAQQMIARFPDSPETILAHGALAHYALGAEDFRRARSELEVIITRSHEARRVAVARFHLVTANLRLHRTAAAIAVAIDANRAATDACESNEFLDSYEVLLPSAFAATITDAPASIAGVSARLTEGRFSPEFADAVYGRTSRLLATDARWSQALAVLRARPEFTDGPGLCDRLASVLALTQYGAGPLNDDELAQVESCEVTVPTPIVTPTNELSLWVYEARDAIEECVRDARDADDARAPRLAIAAGRPYPRFARTGDRELDACLADALEEVGDPGFDVADPEDFYEPADTEALLERFGSGG